MMGLTFSLLAAHSEESQLTFLEVSFVSNMHTFGVNSCLKLLGDTLKLQKDSLTLVHRWRLHWEIVSVLCPGVVLRYHAKISIFRKLHGKRSTKIFYEK